MRKRYIQDPKTHKLVPAEEYYQAQEVNAPMVMPDIQPYVSQIDGSIINSRSTHKAHLRANGCIEVGNETKYLKPKDKTTPPGLKQRLIEVFNSKL
jgi:hypothetical protein